MARRISPKHQRKHDQRHADSTGCSFVGIAFAAVNAADGAEGENCSDKCSGKRQNKQNDAHFSRSPHMVQNMAPGILTAAPQRGQRRSDGCVWTGSSGGCCGSGSGENTTGAPCEAGCVTASVNEGCTTGETGHTGCSGAADCTGCVGGMGRSG